MNWAVTIVATAKRKARCLDTIKPKVERSYATEVSC